MSAGGVLNGTGGLLPFHVQLRNLCFGTTRRARFLKAGTAKNEDNMEFNAMDFLVKILVLVITINFSLTGEFCCQIIVHMILKNGLLVNLCTLNINIKRRD